MRNILLVIFLTLLALPSSVFAGDGSDVTVSVYCNPVIVDGKIDTGSSPNPEVFGIGSYRSDESNWDGKHFTGSFWNGFPEREISRISMACQNEYSSSAVDQLFKVWGRSKEFGFTQGVATVVFDPEERLLTGRIEAEETIFGLNYTEKRVVRRGDYVIEFPVDHSHYISSIFWNLLLDHFAAVLLTGQIVLIAIVWIALKIVNRKKR